ncbi:MAG: PHP-associated domain-containing protein, partial [Smithellaceae bacterium]|nr:PHP-associated domain-containing protein [Smithellaceae bacterium]
ASANVPYVMAAAAGKNICVIPAMEITTSEEVHLLALFGPLAGLQRLQEIVDRHLFGVNDEDRFGVQAIVNERGEVEGFNHQLLIGATDLPIDSLVDTIHQLGGLAIPAHIDRESFSVLSQLGFIDQSSRFDALEISKRMGIRKGRLRYPELARYAFLTSSDAHFIRDIGTATTPILLKEPTFDEIRMAVSGQNGRQILEE